MFSFSRLRSQKLTWQTFMHTSFNIQLIPPNNLRNKVHTLEKRAFPTSAEATVKLHLAKLQPVADELKSENPKTKSNSTMWWIRKDFPKELKMPLEYGMVKEGIRDCFSSCPLMLIY